MISIKKHTTMKTLMQVLLVAVLFTACTKEASNEFIMDPANPQNDTTWATSTVDDNAPVNKLIESLALPYLVDSFDIVTGGVLHCDNNGQINMPANCLEQPVTGKVKVEYLYLKTKGDMVRYAKPTVSNNRLLISGGAFFLKVSKDGNNYQLAANAKIKILYTNPSPDNVMQLFYGDTTVNSLDGFTWQPSNDSSGVTTWRQEDSSGVTTGYQLLSKKFGWINCDKFADTSVTRTRLVDTLPVNFTNKNTAVFAVFKEQWSVLRLYADAANKYFYADNIPVGSKIILLSISKVGDDFYLGSKEVTVTANAIEGLEPQITTMDNISSFIDSL